MTVSLRLDYQEDVEGCLEPLQGLVELVLRVVIYSRGGDIGEFNPRVVPGIAGLSHPRDFRADDNRSTTDY